MLIAYCSLVPQFISGALTSDRLAILVDLSVALHAERDNIPSSSANITTLSMQVTEILSFVVDASDYFAPNVMVTKEVSVPGSWLGSKKTVTDEAPSPNLIIEHLRACVTTSKLDVAEKLIDKLCDFVGVEIVDAQKRIETVILPLMPHLRPILGEYSSSPQISGLDELADIALQRAKRCLQQYSWEGVNFEAIIHAVILSGKHEFIETRHRNLLQSALHQADMSFHM